MCDEHYESDTDPIRLYLRMGRIDRAKCMARHCVCAEHMIQEPQVGPMGRSFKQAPDKRMDMDMDTHGHTPHHTACTTKQARAWMIERRGRKGESLSPGRTSMTCHERVGVRVFVPKAHVLQCAYFHVRNQMGKGRRFCCSAGAQRRA